MKWYSISRRKLWITGAALSVALLSGLLLIVSATGYDFLNAYFARTTFVPETWGNDAAISQGMRSHMVDDLIASGRLDRLRREQVIDLLGPPTGTSKFRDAGLIYWLGPERGFISIDSEWLLIYFKNGIVSRVTVARD